MQVEGIPDGWELVRVGPVCYGEWRLMESGAVKQWDIMEPSLGWAVVLRKIEKPKQYRPFANAAEFEPHRDKWIKQKLENADHRFKTQAYSNLMHYAGQDGEEWEAAFDYFEFEDGTPFGVEVTE